MRASFAALALILLLGGCAGVDGAPRLLLPRGRDAGPAAGLAGRLGDPLDEGSPVVVTVRWRF